MARQLRVVGMDVHRLRESTQPNKQNADDRQETGGGANPVCASSKQRLRQ